MRTSSIIRSVHRSSRQRHGHAAARGLLLAAGLVAGAALTAGRAHAQIDPYRTAVSHPTTGLYQVLGGSWGWERALVGEIYIEDAGLGGAVHHWALYGDYDARQAFELAPSGATYAGLEDFLAVAKRTGATLVPVSAEQRRCEAAPTCVTLTRGGAGSVADALIRQSEPDRNFGASASLTVSDGEVGVRRALLRFDTSRIPRGAVVVSAELGLRGLLYGGASTVYPVLAPWDEATVTWSSFARSGRGLGAGPSGPYLARPTAVMPYVAAGAPMSTSLATLVQGWIDGTVANHGVLLGRRGVDAAVVYASSEHPDPAQRPQLTVCYEACADQCATGCEAGLVCAGGACRAPEGSGCTVADGRGGACSGHGACLYDQCFCEPGFDGDTCEVALGCPHDCSGNGQCAYGQCFCEPGFDGEACELALGCPNDCSAHGVCAYGQCFCDPGFSGAACDPLRQ